MTHSRSSCTGFHLLLYSVGPFTPSVTCSCTHSPLATFFKWFKALPSLDASLLYFCSSCPRSVLWISFYFLTASAEQSPSFLLVPGPNCTVIRPLELAAGAQTGRQTWQWQNTMAIIEAAAMLQCWQRAAAPLRAHDLDGLCLEEAMRGAAEVQAPTKA